MITLDDAKAHLNVTGNADDALITAKIAAADGWIRKFCGGTIDGEPEELKEACRQLVAHLYENREATIVDLRIAEVSPGLFDLMAPYRTWVF